ncbi:MAG: hypothetical protein HQK64_03450 [Desulfamplus sp.]|nr:hypothetical protein [Desulfamplus sp.]MBF0389845.1 hypothetical protein [Desulfamplus sp.]
MLEIGNYNELVVQREVSFGFYLNPKEEEVLLPSKYVPETGLKPGDKIMVFIYTDSEDRPIATTLKPNAVVGEFAYLKVTDIAPFGAFLDWGLEKELFIPKNEMVLLFKKGERHVVKLCLDKDTNRVYATAKIEDNCIKYMAGVTEGMAVDLLIYAITNLGYKAIINNTHYGVLYKNETFEPLKVGDRTKGYIHRIRDDGKIDLRLKKAGYSSVEESAAKIVDMLKDDGGFIPLHDKSPTDAIMQKFGMSKKEFKRSIGKLYKERTINISDNGISLLEFN